MRLRLWPYLARQRRALAALAGWTALVALPTAASGTLVAAALDAVADGRPARVASSVALLAATGVAGGWAALGYARSSAELSVTAHADLTRDVVAGTLAAAVADDLAVSRGGAEITQHLAHVHEILGQLLRMAPQAAGAVAALAGVAVLSPALGLMLAPFAAAAVLVLWTGARRVEAATRRSALASERSHAGIADAVHGVRDVVAYGAEPQVARELGDALQDARRSELAFEDALTIFAALRTLAGVVGPTIVVVAALPWLLRTGALSPGEAVGAVTYVVAGMSLGVGFAGMLVGNLVQARVYLVRLGERMRPADARGSGQAPSADLGIVCRGVTFAWSASALPIVRDLDLEIGLGEHLAIVGASGAGKSTLSALLAGLLVAQSGSITAGGVAVSELAERERLFAVVPQESYVFAGSLRENLTYLNPGAGDAEIRAAAGLVGLDRVLDRLGGLDADLDAVRSGLSEGERQLVTLVRTFLSTARVVVLDEATCYLDPVAEERAERAFVARGGTLIVIAHRMSSSLRAGRVLVLDGASATVGTHDELMRTSPLYADLHGLWTAGVAG